MFCAAFWRNKNLLFTVFFCLYFEIVGKQICVIVLFSFSTLVLLGEEVERQLQQSAKA